MTATVGILLAFAGLALGIGLGWILSQRAFSHHVDELRQALDQAQSEARTDPLTGLGNRKAFDEQLGMLTGGATRNMPEAAAPNTFVVALVEGWRGEICHVGLTDGVGRFVTYKVVDPSFHNWMGLAMAMRNQQISDFPLCNKSFNLSYCGHDL